MLTHSSAASLGPSTSIHASSVSAGTFKAVPHHGRHSPTFNTTSHPICHLHTTRLTCSTWSHLQASRCHLSHNISSLRHSSQTHSPTFTTRSHHIRSSHDTASSAAALLSSPATSLGSAAAAAAAAGRPLLGWSRQLPIPRPTLTLCSAAPKHRPLAEAKDSFEYLDISLAAAQHVRVRNAKFVKSSTTVEDCPSDKHPEFAVIGRSNVGKSSLINTLTDMTGLAKVSKEPGRTRLINHYLINDSWFLVDLPGYGFAKVAKDSKFAWLRFTKNYFVKREALVHVLLLVDASIPTPDIDVECANWLAECQVPFAIVFTKMDTRKKDAPTPQQNILALKKSLSVDWEALPICFETSSRTGAGKTELLSYLGSLREMHLAEAAPVLAE